jgi:hypothetical protein
MALRIGGTPTQVSIWLLDEQGNELLAASQSLADDPNPRSMTFDFGRQINAAQIRLEVLSLNDSEPAHVHLWEVSFSE